MKNTAQTTRLANYLANHMVDSPFTILCDINYVKSNITAHNLYSEAIIQTEEQMRMLKARPKAKVWEDNLEPYRKRFVKFFKGYPGSCVKLAEAFQNIFHDTAPF